MSSSGSGTVTNYGSGSDFLTSYGPVPVPQHCRKQWQAFAMVYLSRFPITSLIAAITGIVLIIVILFVLRVEQMCQW
jgi:hypothetical protein